MRQRKKIDALFIKYRQELIDRKIVKNKTKFATELGSYPTVIAKIERGEISASITILIRFNKLFGDYFDEPISLSEYDTEVNNIAYISEATAGPSIDIEFEKSFNKFKIPGLKGKLFAFHVAGDSMYPTLNNGDLLVCEEVNDKLALNNNHIYVIHSSNGINVKRINIQKKDGEITRLTLISDNDQMNSPVEVDFSIGLHSAPFYKLYRPVRIITENGLL